MKRNHEAGLPASVQEGAVPAFAVALIAGGQSTRMGRDKAWIDWQGRPLWQVQLGKLMELKPARALISCRKEQQLSMPCAETLHDPPDNQGPLPALARCVEHARMPVLALAVDMPGVTVAFMREMRRRFEESGRGVVFRTPRGWEPMCTVYPPGVLPLLHEALMRHELRLQTFIQSAVNTGLLDVIPLSKGQETFFFNLNTPADLAWMPPPPST